MQQGNPTNKRKSDTSQKKQNNKQIEITFYVNCILQLILKLNIYCRYSKNWKDFLNIQEICEI